jgi:hypothetical protein
MPNFYNFVDERVSENTTYFYALENVDMNGVAERTSPIRVQTGGTTVAVVNDYRLEQNYPNPFNPETTICFTMAETENVEISIFNIDGKLVRTLVNSIVPAGEHSVIWDGRDLVGRKSPSGSYLYQLRTRNFTQTKKLTLLH